jgi:hypothetical protein
MAYTDWSARLTTVGASTSEVQSVGASYYSSTTAVQGALDILVQSIGNTDLLIMLNTWRVNAGPFGYGFPGGGLPFGTRVALLTGNAADDTSAVSAGTGQKLSVAQTIVENVDTNNASGPAVTLPDVTADTMHLITLTANCTFTFPTAAPGKSFLLAVVQDAAGSRTVSWPASVKWPGATAATLTSTPGKTDVLSFACADGTHWLGFVSGQNY